MMSDENGKITASDVTELQLSYLKGLRDSVQEQIDKKENKLTRTTD